MAGSWRAEPASWIVGLIALRFEPALWTLTAGQVNILAFLLAIASLDCLRSGRLRLSAAVLSAGLLIKPTGALIWVYLLLRGQWRYCLQVLAFCVAISMLCLWITGLQPWTSFVSKAMPYLATGREGLNNPYNQSMVAFVYRSLNLILPNTAAFAVAPVAGRLLGLGTVAVALVAFGRRRLAKGSLACDELAIVLLIGWLLTPTAWNHHLVHAIMAFGVLLRLYLQQDASKLHLAAWMLALVLVGMIDDYYVHPLLQSGPAVFLSFIKLYGVLILWVLLILGLRDRRSADLWVFSPTIASKTGDI